MDSMKKLLDRSSRFLQRTLSKPAWDFSRFVDDPRSRHGRRWSFNPLMTALLFGLITNRRSLRGVEELTEWQGRWVRTSSGRRRNVSTKMRHAVREITESLEASPAQDRRAV